MFYLALFIFPSVEAGLKGVALLDAESFHLRSDGVFLVFGNAKGAAV